MKFAKTFFLAFSFVCANHALAGDFYPQTVRYQLGGWIYGCDVFLASNAHFGPYWYKTNYCLVDVPSGATGVTAYGINHSSDGWSHWPNQSPFFDSQNVDDYWAFHGPGRDQTNTNPIVKHDSLGILYWDEICDYHGFYYENGSTFVSL